MPEPDRQHRFDVRLADVHHDMLDWLKSRFGCRKSEVVRHAIRVLYEAERQKVLEQARAAQQSGAMPERF